MWTKVSDKMPNDNDDCLLLSKNADVVVGPIVFKANAGGGAWLDIFATPEAGYIYTTKQVGWWMLFEDPSLSEDPEDSQA